MNTRLAEPSGAIFFCAFARKKRPLRFGLKYCFGAGCCFVAVLAYLSNSRNAVDEIRRADKRHGYAMESGDRPGMA